MKYKYLVKIHSVIDYSELEKIMNDYGKSGSRVMTVDYIGNTVVDCRSKKKFVLYLEEKSKKYE